MNINTLIEYRQWRLLKEESVRSSISMAELIRRAIDHTYRPYFRARIRGYEINFGIWKRPDSAIAGRRVRHGSR